MGIQDIVILFFLTRHVGKIAVEKKLEKGMWQLYTVLAWFAGLYLGSSIGMLLFGPKNLIEILKPENGKALISVMLTGYMGAVGGYHILKTILNNKNQSPS